MLYGEFTHQIDGRYRIRIPFRFKEELGNSYVFCLAEDGIISIYSQSVAEEKFGALRNVSPFDRRTAKIAMNFLSSLYNAEDDGQGRVIIPEPLRDRASLGKDVVSVGMGDHIELMSAEKRAEVKSLENAPDYYEVLNNLYNNVK